MTAIACTVPRWWLEEVERLLADQGEYRLQTEAQAALRSSGPGGSRADEMLSEEAFERIAASRAKNGRGAAMTPDGSGRRLSPLGDSRERPVPRRSCRHQTIAYDATCDRCHETAVTA